jgi:hypothetical protein
MAVDDSPQPVFLTVNLRCAQRYASVLTVDRMCVLLELNGEREASFQTVARFSARHPSNWVFDAAVRC